MTAHPQQVPKKTPPVRVVKKDKNRPTKLYIFQLISTTALAIFVSFFLAERTWGMFEQSRVIARDRERAEAKLRELEYKTDEMDKKVKQLRSKEGREAALRAEFNVGRPGEKVIIIVDDPLQEFPQNGVPEQEQIAEGSWEWFANKRE